MLIFVLALAGQLNRTSSYVNVPTVPEYNIAGMWGGGLIFSMPMFTNDPDPTDSVKPDNNAFNMVFRYGLGKGEVALSMFSPSAYSISGKYLIKKADGNKPAFFAGIDNVSYNPYLSAVGMGKKAGSVEEKGYGQQASGRIPELFSLYVAMQETFKPVDFVIGLGRGEYVGNSWRSHYFNTDLFILGDEYATRKPSAWVVGLFFGGSIKIPGGVALMVEMSGRDAAIGVKQTNKYFTATFAINKVEYFGSFRPYSPRLTFGVEANNRFIREGPQFGTMECVIQDMNTKAMIPEAVVDIKEMNKRYRSTGGTFNLSIPVGNYTITISKPDYVDYAVKISIKNGVKTKMVFNLKKTEEAMRREAAAVERDKSIKTAAQQGTIYFSEGNLDDAKKSFEMVLSLDPENAEAKDYLAKIDSRRAELIAAYAAEAKNRAQAKDLAKAIEFWQKVLKLDPANAEAKTAVASLQKQIKATKTTTKTTTTTKPPVAGTKPTKEEIEALYNKGISYFTAEKYDDALKVFNQVLALDPGHQGAKNYKKRTEARIKALKGG
jgi:tetratricopeptide (TPR) repeat protein